MSRIYFHSQSEDDVFVSGAERAHMGILCSKLLEAAIGPISDSPEYPSWVRRFLPPDVYFASETYYLFEQRFLTWLRVADDGLIVNGKKIDVFSLTLNTAHRMGNDAIKLMARLHGQCEIHCYVEGPNRAWLADLIERGRAENILRAKEGWESVVELLRKHDDEPVVTSFSVTRQFPNWEVPVNAGTWRQSNQDDEDYETWYELPGAEQWRLVLDALRQNQGGLELKPDNWQSFYFTNGLTGFDLAALAP